ncbi:hypothetical protein RJ639_042015 [Escallonia herrerae]|uniref:Aminotransferase class I/classII large domain-containing protein n=1 Tax=Escallonia herrerae TaxID=1293975 RepID=A0AA88WHH0_9ASTE|nr:hypothetical protein RJ639_042015 [Escallonia herrerae]
MSIGSHTDQNPSMGRELISLREFEHTQKYPDSELIRLGIGDTTKPIPDIITSAMAEELRQAIAETFYEDTGVKGDEIFVSDGAQSGISRLQLLFGSNVTIAVQNPSFPCLLLMEARNLSLKSLVQERLQSKSHLSPSLQGSRVSGLALNAVVDYYKDNAKMICDALASVGLKVYGGRNAPYVWVHFPGLKSWDVFAEILEKAHVITVPGRGFGPGGEEFIRISTFGHRESIAEASRRLKSLFIHN